MPAQIFETPQLRPDEEDVLGLISDLRSDLSHRVSEPRRWTGTLRKLTFARAVQGSNSIEGYDASLDDVAAVVEGEPTLETSEETELALAGYRDAMTYVLQIASDDESVAVDEGLVKSLHFMMIKHDLTKNPGRWRPGAINVRREETGEIVYEGSDRELVPDLIAAALEQLENDDAPVLIDAAMAHLNLTLIHPFSDGNGRMGRCLQTLVLARDRLVAPVFSSIEEFLGRNTESYYDVLAEVGGGSWQPGRDARPWIRFCLRAHYLQMRTVLRRQKEIEAVYSASLRLAEQNGLPERSAAGLMEAAYGVRLRRGSYKDLVEQVFGDEISDLTSTRDLKAMVERGLLTAVGERRARYYIAGKELSDLHKEIRAAREPKAGEDPFEVMRSRRQLSLGVADGS